MRLYGVAPLRWLATAYVEVIRGTPLLIQLYLIYYGLPKFGIRLNAFVAAVLGLGLNYAAYEAENYRAGIQAIPRGQTEAALALGMSAGRRCARSSCRRPSPRDSAGDQRLHRAVQGFSLVSVITMVELTKVYGMLATDHLRLHRPGPDDGRDLLRLSYPASLFANRLERKLRHDRR